MYIILKSKLLQYVKDALKVIPITLLGVTLVIAAMFIKYKPVYEITISGKQLGYIYNINKFNSLIEKEIINQEEKYVANIALTEEPKYKLKLLARGNNLNEDKIIEELKENDTVVTYKYYEISLNNETKSKVDTLENAEKLINEIKSEFSEDEVELNFQIDEIYTENLNEISTTSLEVAANTVEDAAREIQEESHVLSRVNDIKISALPVNGRISSRYGERSRIRSSAHTGLDIACSSGTDIKAVSSGTVTCSSYQGAYGNLVKIDHGNGVETWYGHCKKLYTEVGKEVKAGEIIASVGSTGNSTGPHLHFEIRIDGNTVNPQDYVY